MSSQKKVLITGKNSYIGNAVKNWLMRDKQQINVDEVCVKDKQWRQLDFSNYDVIFHVAGIAHSDTGHATEETKALYYQVNTDLTIEIAKKAKLEGIRQFVFMSSMIVYGESAPVGVLKRINQNTPPSPTNFYGDSKWQAEMGLAALRSDLFKVALIRPPMVYGKGAKGNYPRLSQLAQKLPVFLDVENERSMIHIENLCEFIRHVIRREDDGVFHPQNAQYVKTSDLVIEIAAAHGKQMRLTKAFNPLLKALAKRVSLVNKVFGNLSYELALSAYEEDYQVRGFKESVILTEK